jgi:hypothetical protein
MFIAWIRNRLGWTLFIGGYVLLAYEIYLWRKSGVWNQFPITLVIEWFIHSAGDVVEYVPFIHPDGVEMLRLFLISDLLLYLERFLRVIPISGFTLVLGYFFIRWEKYLGKK